jgi:hypothetical protein
VRDHVKHVLTLRSALGVASLADPDEVPFVGALLDAPPTTLGPLQRRRVALGLALALKHPIGLLLSDPLADLSDDEADDFLKMLSDYEKLGTTIVCIVPSHRAAARLTTKIHHTTPHMHQDRAGAFFLLRSERPRELAGLLSADPHIISTRVHPEIPGELSVEAIDEESGATAITSAVCRAGVEVFEMRQTSRVSGGLAP